MAATPILSATKNHIQKLTSRRTQPATRWVVDFMIVLTYNPFVEDRTR